MRKECMFSELGSSVDEGEEAGPEQMRESLLREMQADLEDGEALIPQKNCPEL